MTSSTEPRLLNARKVGHPNGPVYIGRPSEWGNPFQAGLDGTRDEVIDKFEAWFRSDPGRVARAKRLLRGKDLLCWCAPKRCHGEVLLRIANEE